MFAVPNFVPTQLFDGSEYSVFVFRTFETGLAPGPSYTSDLSSPFQLQVRTAQIVA